MHVGQFLYYNVYVPPSIRGIVDKYYSVIQNNENTTFKSESSLRGESSTTDIDRRDILFNYLINEDIQLSANSSYVTLNELFDLNTAGDLVDKTISTEGAVQGVYSKLHSNYRNMFNYSLWEKTEPMNISLKIVLYSKTDPLIDVVIPAYMIMGHAGLDKINSSSGINFAVPGISFAMSMYLYKKNKYDLLTQDALNTMSDEQKLQLSKEGIIDYQGKIDPKTNKEFINKKSSTATKKSGLFNSPFNSKLFSLLIDGLVYLDKAYMKSVSVTFSKHTAKSSADYNGQNFSGDYPIWAELDVQIESIVPAISSMLWDSLTTKGSTILTNQISGS